MFKLYLLFAIYGFLVICVTYFIIKKTDILVVLLLILCLVVDAFGIGLTIGVKQGESNVLKGKPTYRMLVNYQMADSVCEIKDTTYILK